MLWFAALRVARDSSTDELLAQYQRSGDADCLGELYLRFADMVFLVCQKYLGNAEDSKDAVMDIFEKLPDLLPKRSNNENFKGWLYVVSKNHCLMKLRKNRNVTVLPLDNAETEKNNVDNITVPHYVEEDEPSVSDEELDLALAQLNSEQKQCIELFYFHNKRYKIIADETGFSLKQVKSFIQNGKRKLGILLRKKANRSNE